MANDLITGYAHHTWQKGEVLTADGLNNIENGLWGIIARFKGESTDSSTFNPSQKIAIKSDIEALHMTSTGNSLQTILTLNQDDGVVEVTYQDIQKASGNLQGVVAAGKNLSANNGTLNVIDSPNFNGTLTISEENSDTSVTIIASSGAINASGAITAGSLNTNGAITAGSLNTSGAITAGSLSASNAITAGSLNTSGILNAGTSTLTSLNIGTNNDNTHYTIGSFTNNGINFYKNLSIAGSLNLTGNSNTLIAGATTLSSLNIGTGTEENGTTIYSIASLNNDNVKLYKPTSINNTLNVTGATTLSSLNIGTNSDNTHYTIGSFTTDGINFYKNLNIGTASTNNDITTYSVASFETNSISFNKILNISNDTTHIATFGQGLITFSQPLYLTSADDNCISISPTEIVFYEPIDPDVPDNTPRGTRTLDYNTIVDLLALLDSNQPSGGD